MIRVVHPCGTLQPHTQALELGLSRLEAAGCHVRWDPARGEDCWRGYLAGTDRRRADELIDALSEPGVDAVWFARGGSGGARIAAEVARAAAELPPRALIGFSDATVFLDLFASRVGWVTFHGPVVTSLGHPAIAVDLDQVLAVLQGTRTAIPFAPPSGAPEVDELLDGEAPHTGLPSCVEGQLMGGNLTVLAASIGTAAAPAPVADGIWLLEDVGEAPYRLDRSFWQIQASGALAGARAVWLGDLGLGEGVDAEVGERLGEDSALPIISGAPAGHRGRLDLLPIGGLGVLDPTRQHFRATAPWVAGGPP